MLTRAVSAYAWSRVIFARPRNDHSIAVYREGEGAERGEVTLDEAAETLAVSPATIRRLIIEGVLPASQSCEGAPWSIRAFDLRRPEVAEAAERKRMRLPETSAV